MRRYWQCQECQLVFLDKAFHLSVQEEKNRYDQHQNSPEDPGYVNFLKRLADPLAAKLKPGYQGPDFGCGPGPALGGLMIQAGFIMDEYDVLYFPRKEHLKKKYDFITCTEVIEHFRRPREEFLLFDRLLREGRGFLGIMTEIRDPETDFETWWYRKDPTHISFYSKETFQWTSSWMGWDVEFPCKNIVIYTKNQPAARFYSSGQMPIKR